MYPVRNFFLVAFFGGGVAVSLWASWPLIAKADYGGSITARESLILAVGSDLKTYQHYSNSDISQVLDEIHDSAFALYSAGAYISSDGSWLLQPGSRRNHRDYRYAGNTEIPQQKECSPPNTEIPHCNLIPSPVQNIGMDVSHFLAKWPIFITSFQEASYSKSSEKEFFSDLITGLEVQLFKSVIRRQDSSETPYLLSNYMDGTNGVYRWNYEDRGKDWGYGAYQLSVTPCYSALLLLDSSKIREMYGTILSSIPYSEKSSETIGGEVCNSPEAELLVRLSELVKYSVKQDKNLVSAEEDRLFEEVIRPFLLSEKSWIGKNAYRGVVGQNQAILHAAFHLGKEDWISIFDQHFEKFTNAINNVGWSNTSEYHKWHYMLFASRYLALSAQHNGVKDFHQPLKQYLYHQVSYAWEKKHEKPVSHTGWGEPKLYNYRDWVSWKTKIAKRKKKSGSSFF